MSDAPERLATSAEDADLRALLRAGRDEAPRPEDLEALVAKLGPSGGGPKGGGSGGAATGTATHAGASLAAKAIAAIVVVAAVGSGALLGVHAWRAQETETAVTTPADSTPKPTPVPAPMPTPMPTPTLGPLPAPSSSSPSPDQLTLLQQAQDALRSDPSRALALCTTDARVHPSGMLGQEREVIAIDALVRLGRRSEAEGRARRFVRSYPGSPDAQRIETILGEKLDAVP